MTVAKRMYLLMFVAVLGLLSLAGLGQYQMSRVYDITNFSNVNSVPRVTVLDEALAHFVQLNTLVWQHMANTDNAKMAAIEAKVVETHNALTATLKKYEDGIINDPKDREMLGLDRAALTEYDTLAGNVLTLTLDGKHDEARDTLLAGDVVISKLESALREHRQYNVKLGVNSATAAAGIKSSATVMSYVIAGAILLVVILLGVYITRSITLPLNNAVKVAQTVASGDLTSTIVVTSQDETGQLLQALKDMNDSLVKIIGEVRSDTDTIATATSQIAAGNLDLSSRTEQQASSLEETASSMEELTSTVKQNADNARQANQLAVSASEVAIKGGDVVSRVVDTMGSINDSARKIVDIIGVIDGIAFQTNILALNAAVEAARAGEQGRGFAVVATEVRNLAQRSAAAAKEIKSLIDDSVEKVEVGSRLVGQAGTTMAEIVASVKLVTDIMGEVTAASQEQSAGIEQVNQAITQMDEVTQQNAALVEEAAGAAASLEDQAGNLMRVVSVFKVNGQQAAAPTAVQLRTVRATPTPALPSKPQSAKPMAAPPRKLTPATAPRKQLATAAAGSDSSGDWEEF
jgi:methyl-accepting chemotaxis protein